MKGKKAEFPPRRLGQSSGTAITKLESTARRPYFDAMSKRAES